MSATDDDLDALSRTISKMPGRTDRVTVQQTIEVLFETAASKMDDDKSKEILANLQKHVAQVELDLYRPKPRYMDAFFFPNKDNVYKLVKYIKMARKSLLICVFNLTNNDLAKAIKQVWDSGVDVKIITDDECMKNKGNDCQELADYGIPVRTDDNEQYHMHNKFMVVDDAFLLTGSFNWTFQAGANNQENLLVVDHPYYIESYQKEFTKLWKQFESQEVQAQERAARTIQNAYRGKQNKQNYKGKSATSAPGYKFQGW